MAINKTVEIKTMQCEKCLKEVDRLYFPTKWGRICSSCFLERLSKEDISDGEK